MPETTQESTRRAFVTRPDGGERYRFFGGTAVLRSAPGALPVVIELTFGPGPGAALPPCIASSTPTACTSSAGASHGGCGDDTLVKMLARRLRRAPPPACRTRFFVLGDEPASFLQTHADDSFLRFIRAVGVRATGPDMPPPRPLDRDAVLKAAAETGQPILGPPMTREDALAAR